jgi:hypothetical protein
MLKYPAVKVQDAGDGLRVARVVRMDVRAGSSVERGRSGTSERMGYIAVVFGMCVERSVGTVCAGVRRLHIVFEAASRYFEGDSRGEGAGLEDGHDMVYPPEPGAEEGCRSKERLAMPAWILEKYSVSSAEWKRW